MENVKKFYNALASDKALRERASALNKEVEKPDETTARAAIIAFAKAEGYDFTEADLDAYAKQAKPLADKTLDAVAGGAFNPKTCFCALGGGGVDDNPVTGHTCACVAFGHGDLDEFRRALVCSLAGFIMDC